MPLTWHEKYESKAAHPGSCWGYPRKVRGTLRTLTPSRRKDRPLAVAGGTLARCPPRCGKFQTNEGVPTASTTVIAVNGKNSAQKTM